MIIYTTRFGDIQITEEDVLTFQEGLLGFGDLRSFVLLDDPTDEIFAWLQSCETPDVAFPVLEPELFATHYNILLAKSDLMSLSANSMNEVRAFCIITIPENLTEMTANLKAPIVINVQKRIARQCVLSDNTLAIREPIFQRLQQRVISNPDSLKSHAAEMGVAVQIPNKKHLEPEA